METATDSLVIAPSVFYFGTPVVLVGTTNPDGGTNLTPISSAWALGDIYVLGIGRHNHGTANLLRTGEVTLNLPDAQLGEAVERIAPTTGSCPVPATKHPLYRHEPDKWSLGGFTPAASHHVTPDRVRECPVQMEAELVGQHDLAGDALIVQVRVMRTHAHSRIVRPGTNHIDLDVWRPLYYTLRHYFGQGGRVAVSFKAEQ